MTLSLSSINNRTTSSFPLSIGTARAMEALFPSRGVPYNGDSESLPKRVSLTKYTKCYISIFTLYRNLMTSIDKNIAISLKPNDIWPVLVSEMDIISDLFSKEGGGKVTPIFYDVDRVKESIYVRNKGVVVKVPKNDIEKHYIETYSSVIKQLRHNEHPFLQASGKLKPTEKESALIVTHVAYDLLSKDYFSRLDLLESHTGIVKTYNEWGSKYFRYSSRDMKILPFNRKLLLIFGDGYFIEPGVVGMRKLVYDIAVQCKWNGFTTDHKVLTDLQFRIKEPFVVEHINGL